MREQQNRLWKRFINLAPAERRLVKRAIIKETSQGTWHRFYYDAGSLRQKTMQKIGNVITDHQPCYSVFRSVDAFNRLSHREKRLCKGLMFILMDKEVVLEFVYGLRMVASKKEIALFDLCIKYSNLN